MGQKIKNFTLRVIRQKYLWTIAAFIAIVGFIDPNSFWHRYELHNQNEALKEEIRKYEGATRLTAKRSTTGAQSGSS